MINFSARLITFPPMLRPVLLFLLLLTLLSPVAGAQNAKATAKESKDKPAAEKVVAEPAPDPAKNNIVLPVINLQGLLPVKDKEETAEPEPPPEPSFGTHLLEWLSTSVNNLSTNGRQELQSLVNLPQLDKWWSQQMATPRLAERWQMLGAYAPPVIGWSLLAALTLHLLLTPLRRSLRPRQTYSFAARLGLGLVQFGIGLLPIIALVFCSLTILSDALITLRVRMAIGAVTYALIFSRLVVLTSKLILAPKRAPLRLLPLGDLRAADLHLWLGTVVTVALLGYGLLDAARLMEMPEEPRRFFSRLLGLALLLSLIALIRRNRAPVAAWLRGDKDEPDGDLLSWARHNLSAHWHRLTILYLLIGYTVTILSPLGAGFGALLQGTLITVLLFLLMNVLIYGLNQLSLRAALAQAQQERLPLHQPVLLALMRLLVTVGGVYLILLGWNVDFSAWMKTETVQRLTGAGFSVTIAVIVAVLCYEMLCSLLNAAQQRARDPRLQAVSGIDRVARTKTLLPLIRHSAAVVLTIAVMLVGLSELGINIAPLLAGAGIVGVAVGFGSQALVKDFITGLFIIIEDTIHVGDVVTCGTHSGVVDGMTIRTLRLRDINGALHVIPYSEVTGFINQTRGFAYAVMEVGVAYSADLRRVFAVMAEVGASLQQDPEMGPNILTAAEVNGIVNFADSSIIVRVRIKTLPGQQWNVRFAYMLALKERFDAENIVIPFPTVTHQFAGPPPVAVEALVALPPQRPDGAKT